MKRDVPHASMLSCEAPLLATAPSDLFQRAKAEAALQDPGLLECNKWRLEMPKLALLRLEVRYEAVSSNALKPIWVAPVSSLWQKPATFLDV